jgi:uncharacterized protein (TIGR03067 family)
MEERDLQPMCYFVLVSYILTSPPDPTKSDRMKSQGSWEIVSIESHGDKLTGEAAKKEHIACVIKEDQLVFTQAHETYHHRFKLNPQTKPGALDIIYPNGKGVNHAIYKLEKDRLMICVSRKWNPNSPEERPISFTSNPEKNKNLRGLAVYTFRRKK